MPGDQLIVINACFGGFGLSEAAIRAYAARKGLTLYPERGPISGMIDWWIKPEGERGPILEGDDFHKATPEARDASNKAYSDAQLYDKDLDRTDPDLVAVVQELGADSWGQYAKLKIARVPTGVEWDINEYDGFEHVSEKHRTWHGEDQ